MNLLLLAMMLATEPPDALFPFNAAKEIHLHPALFIMKGAPLDESTFGLPSGAWYPGLRLKLSSDFTGYLVFNSAGEVFPIKKTNPQ